MKTTLWRGLVAGAAMIVVAAACDDNPVDEGVDQVARVSFSKAFASVAPGDSIQIAATPLNKYGNPLGSGVTFTACSNKVSVATSARDDADLAEAINVWIKGTSDLGNLGYTCVEAASGGVTDTIRVLVVPPYLLTSVGSAGAGDTIAFIRSLGQPAFDSNVSITAESKTLPPVSQPVYWLKQSSTSDTLYAVLPVNMVQGDYRLNVSGIGPNDNAIGADFTIDADASVTDAEPNSPPGPAVSMPWETVGTFADDADTNDWYLLTLPEDGTLHCRVAWDRENEGTGVIVFYVYDADLNFIDYVYAFPPDPSDVEYDWPDLTAGDYNIRVRNYTPANPTSYYVDCSLE